MKLETIKKLATESFTQNELDEKKVSEIVNLLKREELKIYIKLIKKIVQEKTVIVTIPSLDASFVSEVIKDFSNFYKDKKIIVKVDPSILSGIKIENADMIFEQSMRKNFSDLIELIDEKAN